MENVLLKDLIYLLFDAGKLMIPVVTGFIVLFGGSLGQLWIKGKTQFSLFQRSLIVLTMFLGLSSLGVWTGAMAYCLRATEKQSLELFKNGQLCGQIGHITFFVSVCLALSFYLTIFLSTDKTR